ncbi:MAG TPA: thioredoxin domain-containing protein [Rhizomicrobium sp.]|nr:thioredoxin domain-containing protein [Rhizomicrobium sp.]
MAVAAIALAVIGYLTLFGSGSSSVPAGGEKAGVKVQADDMTMGNPNAPIMMLEYAAPTCPHCARFTTDIFPALKQKYIDTGKVYYVFRVFPLSSVDLAAEALARCMPKGNYFQFLELLFRNQDKWDPEYGVKDVHAALVTMGRIAGMAAPQVDACMSNQEALNRASKVGSDATASYGINGTPSFIVNGQLQVGESTLAAWQTLLDSKLPKK